MKFVCSILVLFLAVRSLLAQTFTEVSIQSGINDIIYSPTLIGGGCAFFDYNNDGWLDIYMTSGMKRDKLYRNNADGTFTDVGFQAGLGVTNGIYTMGVVTGDIDNDGDRDIFVTTAGNDESFRNMVPNFLFLNNGNGTFTDISQSAGIKDSAWSVSATMGDYNLDGLLDIYVANYVDTIDFIFDSITNKVIGFAHTGYADYLYLNNGNNTFTQVALQLQVDNMGVALAANFTDYDNDHDLDIYVANDFGEWVIPNKLYRNEYPANAFTDVSVASGVDAAIYGMGIAIGDYDEDGDLDYYVTNIGENVLHRNNGNGTFTDVAAAAGVANGYLDSLFTTGWGTFFLDYDNDTWLDLFVADGFIPAAQIIATTPKDPKKLYKNNMNGTFTDVSLLEGVSDSSIARGCAMGDYDNDGDLDLLVAIVEQDTNTFNDEHVLLYRNDVSNGNRWLKVNTVGTQNNRDGYGSRVEVYRNGRKWIREIDGGSSHASQNSSIAHFGLGSYDEIDSMRVIWPGGGITWVPPVPVNHLFTVYESGETQTTANINSELCEGDSIFAGGAFQKNTGTYYDTLNASWGDSIIVTHLTVHPIKLTTLQFSICAGDSIFLVGEFRKNEGNYYDTLSSASGCDSIVTHELEVMPLPQNFIPATICAGDSLFAGGGWQKQPGTYYDTFPASLCNFVYITLLSVQEPYHDSVKAIICEGDSFYAGGGYQTATGVYSDSLVSVDGCDSIRVCNLRVDEGSVFSTTITISEGDSVFAGGGWQTEAGVYTDVLANTNGCDSTVTTELQVLTNVSALMKEEISFEILPNPSNGDFSLHYLLPNNESMKIEMFSVSGKFLRIITDSHQKAGRHLLEFNGLGIEAGVYIMSFRTSGYAIFRKALIF